MKLEKRAQALVEFALILPVLLAFLLAIIDGAFLVQGYLTVNHAAREASRFAAVYRPSQGECLNHDQFGTPLMEPYPYCPINYQEDPSESENDYFERRVELIKLVAEEATLGLRRTTICHDNSCIVGNFGESGMTGVRVWGFPSFEESEQEDHPGLPGLPVRVYVVHNVPLVVFGSILPDAMVRVNSFSEMINEGIQVGWGNQAVPTFSPIWGQQPPGTAVATNTPAPSVTPGPTPTPTLAPVYNIDLSPASALNMLPDEREHMLTASVTDDMGRNVAGARVTFSSNAGSFQKSGIGGSVMVATTGDDGKARVVIYANAPVTATIRAWLDYNGNQNIDAGEPSDTATKVWELIGPYLIVSDHNPAPLAWISTFVGDHPVSQSPFSLWWCPTTITATQTIAQVAYPVNVDANGEAADIPVGVPVGAAGHYRIESHSGDGGADGCAQPSTLVAYSGLIEIAEVPPDLVIESVTFVDEEDIEPGKPITLSVTIRNDAPVPVPLDSAPFDLDTYLNIGSAPQSQQLGQTKQWVDSLGPFASTVITTVVTVYEAEDHELWLQVDTTNYVDEGTEGGEDNNVYGPITIPVSKCLPLPQYSDDFDGGLNAPWSSVNFGSAGGAHSVSDDQLVISSRGTSLWSGSNSYYMIYQQISGDFDARLRIIAKPTSAQWAKVGLHAIQNVSDSRYPWVVNMATNDKNPAAEQAGYRSNWNGTANRTSNSNDYQIQIPSWVRIERLGDTYSFYRSNAAEPGDGDWTLQGTHTASVPLDYVGIATASYNSSSRGTGIVDDFEVCRPTKFSSVTPPPNIINPPGLVQCAELLSVSGFEGNPTTVFSYWHAGEAASLTGGHQRTSEQFYRGSFSMRLHASNSVIPCEDNRLQPYLYQIVDMPTEVYTHSTLVVEGRYLIAGSRFECSLQNSPDPDDVLAVSLRQPNGDEIVSPQDVINGGAPAGTQFSPIWHLRSAEMHPHISDMTAYAGQTLRVQWDAHNDTDINGTFFYIDDVSAQLCSTWPVPPDQPGQATIGGIVTTRGENNIPTIMPGTNVWAYSQGTDVLQTRAIHNGSYHFYNIDPGVYIIYAETWVSGELRTVSTSVTVSANERRSDVNLLLQ